MLETEFFLRPRALHLYETGEVGGGGKGEGEVGEMGLGRWCVFCYSLISETNCYQYSLEKFNSL